MDESPGGTTPPDPKHGVLFVHGMGEQQRGDTLLGFGEPMVKFLRDWVGNKCDAQSGNEDGKTPVTDPFKSKVDLLNVEAIRVFGQDPNRPSNTTISIDDHRGQPWLVAESWWATDFKPAKFTDVLNWGIRVVPFVLFDTVRYQLKSIRGNDTPNRRGVNISNIGQLIFTVVMGPLIYSLLVLLLPVGSIPFLRNFVGNIMVRLARSVGDPYLLLSSPIRLASMVERIHHDIRWLQDQNCTGITIVAHSQGAAVAHHALRAFALGEYDLKKEPKRAVPIKRFITLGAAIEKLHFLHQIDLRGKNLLRGGLLRSVVALLLLASVFFGWRFPHWLADRGWIAESARDSGHWWTLGLWLALTILFWIGPWMFQKPMRTELIGYSEPKTEDLWNRRNLDGSMATWVDLYARADPVSLGPILELTRDAPGQKSTPRSPLENPDETSWEIRNQDSILFDHTTYFENVSQFMVPLVGGLCIDSGWTDILDLRQPIFREASAQRSRRVDWLNLSFLTVVATVVLTSIALLLLDRLDNLGIPLKRAIEWLGNELAIPFEGVIRSQTGDGQVAENVLGIVTQLLIATFFYMVLIKGAWQAWDAGKTDILLKQREALARTAPDQQEALLESFENGSGRFRVFTALAPISALAYILAVLIF